MASSRLHEHASSMNTLMVLLLEALEINEMLDQFPIVIDIVGKSASKAICHAFCGPCVGTIGDLRC